MSVLRVMTYALNESSVTQVTDVARLIRSQRPELVYLQHLTQNLLEALAQETGLTAFGTDDSCGYLCSHPLIAVQVCNLGGTGECLRADLTLADKRLHLFNLQLDIDPTLRGQQLARLFDEDLLGASLPCASLVGGDFSLPLWGGGQWLLRQRLKQVKYPGWGANYPTRFPLWPRDRFYLRGPIRSLAAQVVSSTELRSISDHLPVITTLELTDTRVYLKVSEVSKQQMRPVAG